MARPLYSRGKSPEYQLDRRLCEPQNLSGRFGQNKILEPIRTRNPTPRYPGSLTLVVIAVIVEAVVVVAATVVVTVVVVKGKIVPLLN
jgi:hypothetical protein